MINEQSRRGFGRALLFGPLDTCFRGVWQLKDFEVILFHLELRPVREDRDGGFVSHLVVEIDVHAAGWSCKKKCLLFSLRIEGEERFVRLVCGHIASSVRGGGVGDE